MDLLLAEDRAPLTWEAPIQQDAFVWRETNTGPRWDSDAKDSRAGRFGRCG